MRLVEAEEQAALIHRFQDHEPRLVSGGSVANSVIALSQLGGSGAFIGCVGDDRYGLHYHSEFEELDIEFCNAPLVGETSGTCVSIITPDAERTLRTCLAVSSHLAARHVDAERIKASEWLFIEGYVFANPNTGQHAIREALRVAKANGVKVALTCSDAFVVNVFGEAFHDALKQSDLLFCNASEACAVANVSSPTEAFVKLKGMVPSAVVTDGPHGAYIRHAGIEAHVPAFACEPKDLTGAGRQQKQTGTGWDVTLSFNTEGGKKFAELTQSIAGSGRLLGIVLDGRSISEATVGPEFKPAGITGGGASITGNFTAEEARDLEVQLRGGSLPLPVKLIEVRTVGPSLGAENIRDRKSTRLNSSHRT